MGRFYRQSNDQAKQRFRQRESSQQLLAAATDKRDRRRWQIKPERGQSMQCVHTYLHSVDVVSVE